MTFEYLSAKLRAFEDPPPLREAPTGLGYYTRNDRARNTTPSTGPWSFVLNPLRNRCRILRDGIHK